MATIFITGIGGFVGTYLTELLQKEGHEIWGIERNPSTTPFIVQGDITDRASVVTAMSVHSPDYVIHLAGFSSVAQSFEQKALVHQINVEGTRNVLEAARSLSQKPRVLIVSSAEIYGKPSHSPVTESDPLAPTTPYGESRLAQEALLPEYADLEIIVSRSFNHTGPRQAPHFVVPSFAKQIAAIEAGKQSPIIQVGNLDAIRDFSDVRDMVAAYWQLIQQGIPGEVYNLGNGQGIAIKNILQLLLSMSKTAITVERDASRLRPSDIPEMVADVNKFHECIGVSGPGVLGTGSLPLEKTLRDTLGYWRTHIEEK